MKEQNFQTKYEKVTTAGIESELRNVPISGLKSFLDGNKDNMLSKSLKDCLDFLLADKEISVKDVVIGSNIERSYVYDIFNGRKHPSRDKLIAIAFGMKLSYDETQTVLKTARLQPLYAKDSRDVVISSALLNGLNIFNANELLEENDMPIIS